MQPLCQLNCMRVNLLTSLLPSNLMRLSLLIATDEGSPDRFHFSKRKQQRWMDRKKTILFVYLRSNASCHPGWSGFGLDHRPHPGSSSVSNQSKNLSGNITIHSIRAWKIELHPIGEKEMFRLSSQENGSSNSTPEVNLTDWWTI